jgi:NTP pyrophosphatase (non-canonical NTP hydrolase)
MDHPDYLERLYRIVDGLNARFPGGDEPFRMVTRLCEEAGELASAVNHFEGTGVKMSKHGSPDPRVLAKEIQDVLRAALAVARHYGVEDCLRASIDDSYRNLLAEGYLVRPNE